MSIGIVVLVENELNSESEYLMLEQNRKEYDTGSHYAPPAGTLNEDLDSNPEDAAVREVKEETGLEINRDELYELFETDASYGVDKLIWYKVGLEIDEEQIELNHEADDYCFLSREKALEENLLEDTRDAFNKLGEN